MCLQEATFRCESVDQTEQKHNNFIKTGINSQLTLNGGSHQILSPPVTGKRKIWMKSQLCRGGFSIPPAEVCVEGGEGVPEQVKLEGWQLCIPESPHRSASVDKRSFITRNSSVDTRRELGRSSNSAEHRVKKSKVHFHWHGWNLHVWVPFSKSLLTNGIKSQLGNQVFPVKFAVYSTKHASHVNPQRPVSQCPQMHKSLQKSE